MPKYVNDGTCSGTIIAAAIKVHRRLGPGLLESAYEACLARELELRGLAFQRQVPIPIHYEGVLVDVSYRLDLVVDQSVIVELKAVTQLLPIHEAQLLSYLRLTPYRVGLLINFHAPVLKDGIRRLLKGAR